MSSIHHSRFCRRRAPLWAAAVLAPVFSGCASWTAKDWHTATVNIESTIAEQAAAWNRGDLDAFMVPYWKSEQLTFSSGGETQRGWQATYDRYKRRYPTRERMGTLTFSDLEISPLGRERDAALVLGRWKLERSDGPIGGNFSLVFERTDTGWRIVHDHTSLAPAQSPP